MATFMEPKFPISKEQRHQRKAKANHTLEDVAEEILNGILCQYEPPNRTNSMQIRKPSGILRWPNSKQPKNKRHSKQQTKSTRVRWMDEQTEDELNTKIMEPNDINSMVSPTQGGCSVAEACMDAGIEVGCVSAPSHGGSSHQQTSSMNDIATKRMMNAKEAIAIARAKSPRNARDDTEDIVFDDDGNPTYKDSATTMKQTKPDISLPKNPPPPNKKERFFPELCGVRINCGDDEAYVQVIPRYNFENSVNSAIDRCSNNMTDDDDELIMMMDELDNSVLEDNDESDSFGSDVETLRKSMNQVRDRTRRKQDASAQTKKSSSRTIEPNETKKLSMREVVDHYMVKQDSDDDNDDINEAADWEEKMSPTESSANFLRRVWPRNPSGTGGGNKKGHSIPTITDENSDDDGATNKNPNINHRRTTTLRSRSPNRLRREEPTISKPSIVHDMYESVELVNNVTNVTKKTASKSGIGAVLKSIVAKSPKSIKKGFSLSTSSLNDAPTDDWDESVPIVHNLSNSGINNVAHSAKHVPPVPSSTIPIQLPYSNSSQSINNSIPGHFPILNSNQSVNSLPLPPNQFPSTFLPPSMELGHQKSMQIFPNTNQSVNNSIPGQLPYPSTNQNINILPLSSYQYPNTLPQSTMGHGQQQQQPNQPSEPIYPQIHPAHPLVNYGTGMRLDKDDMMERQSFITAHRTGLDRSNNKNGAASNDDLIERQSFIGAYRQGAEEVLNPQRPVGLSSIPETTMANVAGPRQADSTLIPFSYYPTKGPMTRDDLMERQSFITASRQGIDPVQRPSQGFLTHDDIMERMSNITASRQGFDPSTVVQNEGRIPSPPKQSKRGRRIGRSKSPRRNGQSVVDLHNPFPQNMMHNGVYYDSMGNPMYGHQGVPMYYNPMTMPTQPDPPISNTKLTYSGPNDLHSTRGGGGSSYYAAQSYKNPMYMSSNTPYVNHVGPGHVYQNAGNQAVFHNNGSISDNAATGEQLNEPDENKLAPIDEEQPVDPELTWEERTRQAWERIRGGISALTFETAPEERKSDEEEATGTPDDAQDQHEAGEVSTSSVSGVTNQVYSNVQMHPSVLPFIPSHTLAQPHDLVKRVSFGEPQQLIYYDDQDENRSTMSLPGKSNKKKKQFRGAKLVGGVLGKVKNSLNMVTFSRSTSSDTQRSTPTGRLSYSAEWDGSVIHPNHSMSSMSPLYPPGPQQQSYMYPPTYGNQAAAQNSQHVLQQYNNNIDQRFLQPVPQNTGTTFQPMVNQQRQSIDNATHQVMVSHQPAPAPVLPPPQYTNQAQPAYGYVQRVNSNTSTGSSYYNSAPASQFQYAQMPVTAQYRNNDRRSL